MSDSEDQLNKLDSRLAGLEKKLDEAQGERKRLQILMMLLTTITTAVVGFGGWVAQSRIQQHIDDKAKDLQTILALKQEVYSRELDRYESVHQQMAALVAALDGVKSDPTQKKAAVDAINKLYVAYTTDSLYLSNGIVEKLKILVTTSGNLPSLDSSIDNTTQAVDPMQAVNDQISEIETQMKGDLRLEQLGQLPGVKDGTHP